VKPTFRHVVEALGCGLAGARLLAAATLGPTLADPSNPVRFA